MYIRKSLKSYAGSFLSREGMHYVFVSMWDFEQMQEILFINVTNHDGNVLDMRYLPVVGDFVSMVDERKGIGEAGTLAAATTSGRCQASSTRSGKGPISCFATHADEPTTTQKHEHKIVKEPLKQHLENFGLWGAEAVVRLANGDKLACQSYPQEAGDNILFLDKDKRFDFKGLQ